MSRHVPKRILIQSEAFVDGELVKLNGTDCNNASKPFQRTRLFHLLSFARLTRNTAKIVACCGKITLIYKSALIFFQYPVSIRYSPGLGCCAPDFGNGSAAALYGTIYAILGLGLPAVLVTVCNLRVLGIARYHRHRIASAIYEVTLSAQVTITHQRNPFFVPSITAPSAGGPPRFHSAASTVRINAFVEFLKSRH